MKNIRVFHSILLSSSVLFFFILILSNCNSSQSSPPETNRLHAQANAFFGPLPENAFEDGTAPELLIELGKMLYYEPRLSKSGLISCHTCHNLSFGGVDNLPVSIGHMWQKGPRNAPTVLNAALHSSQFHDGREPNVESQALMPILDEVEMASTRERVMAVLESIPEYVELFEKVFSEDEHPLVYENIGVAIGAFERVLITPTRFDNYLRGDFNALDTKEIRGLELFIETGCATCHVKETLGGHTFARFMTPAEISGEREPDLGRFQFTGREEDKHFFKVPSLINIAVTYPYFHDGSEWSLENAINEVAISQLDVKLSEEELSQIIAFLHTLTGEVPEYARELPILPPSTYKTPRPQFD